MLGLVSSNRPTHEMLDPHLLDQRRAFDNQFEGMSEIEFSYDDYDDYEAIRLQLIETVKASLSEDDKAFLLSLNRLTPDWSIYDYQHFPSVKWKLLNLEKFKKDNPESYGQQLSQLESVLAQ
jgi:hypothetical protein